MKIFFWSLFCVFFKNSYLVAAAEKDIFFEEPTSSSLYQFRSACSLKSLLAYSKLVKLDVENRTEVPVTLGVYDFYHPHFDEEDFASDIAVLSIFDHRYQILGEATKKVTTQVFISPYRDKTEENALKLVSYVTILPRESSTIQAIDLSYIGELTCETTDKCISYKRLPENKLLFLVEDKLSSLACEHSFVEPLPNYRKNLLQMMASNRAYVPFLDYLLSVVFKEHRYTKEAFYQKLHDVHQVGARMIKTQSGTSITISDLKIPQITHTLMLTKRVGVSPLLNENQKRWFKKSIETLPSVLGWKHILWVVENPSSIGPEDLGEVAGKIEVRSIYSSDVPYLDEISELVELNLNKQARAFSHYAILNRYGGMIRGIDTEIIRNILPVNAIFSFYSALEADTSRMLESEFLASAPNHPIINRTLDLIRYHNNPHRLQTCSYLIRFKRSFSSNLSADFHMKYGNAPLSLAFQQYGIAGRDMIFGSEMFSSSGTTPVPETEIINYAEKL